MSEVVQVITKDFGTYKVRIPLQKDFEVEAEEVGRLLFTLERNEEPISVGQGGIVDLVELRKATAQARQNLSLANQINLDYLAGKIEGQGDLTLAPNGE